MVIILQCIHKSINHVVHLKYVQILFVSYTSTKLEKILNKFIVLPQDYFKFLYPLSAIDWLSGRHHFGSLYVYNDDYLFFPPVHNKDFCKTLACKRVGCSLIKIQGTATTLKLVGHGGDVQWFGGFKVILAWRIWKKNKFKLFFKFFGHSSGLPVSLFFRGASSKRKVNIDRGSQRHLWDK